MLSIRLPATSVVHAVKLPTICLKRLKSTHVYKEVIPWKHPKDLADDIGRNVLYNKNGIIALNKPYGVGASDHLGDRQYANAAPVGDRCFSLYDTFPYLAKQLKCEELFLASVPERYTSGVTILTTSQNLRDKVKKCLSISKTTEDTRNLYFTVVLGSPSKSSGTYRVGVKISPIVRNQPIIVPYTRSAATKGKILGLKTEYNLLSSSSSAALVSIRASTAKLNAIRVFCTDVLVAPVLGDNMFGSRVKWLLDKPVLVNLTIQSAQKQVKLKNDILEALQLSPGEELIIPNHVHLQEVYLPNVGKKNIILRAPMPSVFQWSCQKLGLEIPPCEPCEEITRENRSEIDAMQRNDNVKFIALS